MSTLVATDLDRTLVHSARAAGPDVPGDVLCLEGRRGVPTAMLTRRTAATLGELARRATWVPATTRSVAEFRRLGLGSAVGTTPRYAACASGGVLLVDGAPDPEWEARVRHLLADGAPVAEAADLFARHLARLDPATTGPVRDADDVLLVARVADPDAGWLDELAADCGARGWRVATHGAKVHLLPAGLDKSVAVAEVGERVAAARLLAAGDSPLDAELLLAADAGVQPADGALHGAGWHAPHVAVTRGVGLAAGEEIAAWLLARAAQV
ncbi:HAD family hydrolase [Actinomycetospora callitridis]|uniref:HAD family hydrolase n=1 Tax=Actinomycetospora callitridis TaxID=913944 RepID=UPI0023656718|nr:HAD family hydrolase [Actinomycetospora callitridis]MDD7920614.1 HAD family hydrolase [Actinomycetospora callitridis]